MSVQGVLRRMEERDFEAYKRDLRRRAKHARRLERITLRDFDIDHPGHPLGRGMPTGRTLRQDGDSHREAWARVIRMDLCSYCGEAGGTVDHIEPRSRTARGIGGAHSWMNFAGACERCNSAKGSHSLLLFLAARAGCGVSLKSREGVPEAERRARERADTRPRRPSYLRG